MTNHLRTEVIRDIKLVGKSIETTLAENKTGMLWGSFMPRRREISNTLNNELYSVEIFDPAIPMDQFTPHTKFVKWAAVPVQDFDGIPEGLSTLTIPGGLYAVFLFKGRSSEFAKTFQYIFQTWLPSSTYQLDTRPQFEVMGEKYKNDHPESEEEIWIPVKPSSHE